MAGESGLAAESDYRWMRYAEHRAAVAGAIAELAGAFDLHAAGDDVWVVRAAAWPVVVGEVVVRVEGDVATSVGVRLTAKIIDDSALKYVVMLMLSLGAMAAVMILAGFVLVILGLHAWLDLPQGLLACTVLGVVALTSTFGRLGTLAAAWRSGRVDRWMAGWRRRFPEALAERLAAGRTYR